MKTATTIPCAEWGEKYSLPELECCDEPPLGPLDECASCGKCITEGVVCPNCDCCGSNADCATCASGNICDEESGRCTNICTVATQAEKCTDPTKPYCCPDNLCHECCGDGDCNPINSIVGQCFSYDCQWLACSYNSDCVDNFCCDALAGGSGDCTGKGLWSASAIWLCDPGTWFECKEESVNTTQEWDDYKFECIKENNEFKWINVSEKTEETNINLISILTKFINKIIGFLAG